MSVHTIDWYRSPLTSEQLKELNERSDFLGFLQAGGYLATLCFTGTLAYLAFMHLSWPWVVAAVFLHGTVGAFLINGVHELVHGTVFKTKWLNALFAQIFSFFGWINHYLFWCSHTEHHKFTLHPPDDLEVVLPVPHNIKGFFKSGFLAPHAVRYFIPNNFRLARGKFIAGWETTVTDMAAKEERRKVILWSRFLLIAHGLVVLGSILSGKWIIAVLVSLIPCYGSAIFWLCNNTQHTGLVDRVPDFRLCCRTILINPILRFLYWHMNYHIEHHMYAGVPCYRLGKLHRLIKHELPPCPNGLLETWVQIGHIMARQKLDKNYQYVQPLPGHTADLDTALPVAKSVAGNANGKNTSRPTVNSRGGRLRTWECSVCGFIYDEALGLPEDGIAPGTAWEDIPEDWSCPDCGVAKADFNMVQVGEEQAAQACTEIAGENLAATAPATRLVIIGSGLAGYSLAKEIRGLGVNRPITILSRDGGEFYSKPMLSNALAENLTPQSLVKSTHQEMAQRFNLDVKPHTHVQRIDRDRRVVVMENGEVKYGQLVLALGADQITLSINGDGAADVLQVNDLESYARFYSQLSDGKRVLIIGAGLIGCEFANDLAHKGHGVEVVDIAPHALGRLAPQQIAEALQNALEKQGVQWHMGTSVSSIQKNSAGRYASTLANGKTIETDVVLSAVGLRPRTSLAQQAGLKINRGIVVDAMLRSSDENIFAVGDCAEVDGNVMPFIHPLFEGVRALSHTLSGQQRAVVYPAMPVVVKTPACPIVVCPPETGRKGYWTVEGNGADLKSLFIDELGEKLLGFALSGTQVTHKNELARRLKSHEQKSTAFSATRV